MKVALVLCLCLVIVGLEAGSVHLSGAQKEKASQNVVECMKETGVKPEVVAEVKKGHLNDDEDLKKFTLCFFQKAGIVTPEGKLNMDVALSKIPPGVDKAEVTKVLEKCKNKEGKDAADTAFQLFKCYHSNTKTHILL